MVLCVRMRPFDLLLQLPLLSSLVRRLLAFLLGEGGGPSLSFGGCVDPGYIDAVILLLETAETFAAKPLGKNGQVYPTRIFEVCMVRVGNVCLVELVGLHALLAVCEVEQIQEVGQTLLGVLFADSADIQSDGFDVAHMAFGLGMLLKCVVVAALFGTRCAVQM